MPNQQPLYDQARTIVGVWTKVSGANQRQYALWSSGELVTRIADGPRRMGSWQPRHTYDRSIPRLLYELDIFLRGRGYTRDYASSGSALRAFFS